MFRRIGPVTHRNPVDKGRRCHRSPINRVGPAVLRYEHTANAQIVGIVGPRLFDDGSSGSSIVGHKAFPPRPIALDVLFFAFCFEPPAHLARWRIDLEVARGVAYVRRKQRPTVCRQPRSGSARHSKPVSRSSKAEFKSCARRFQGGLGKRAAGCNPLFRSPFSAAALGAGLPPRVVQAQQGVGRQRNEPDG